MKFIFILFLIFNTYSLMALEVYSTLHKKNVTLTEISKTISSDAIILMGETHYQVDSIQTQSIIIESLSQAVNHQGAVVAWEFLNYPDQVKISALYNGYVRDEVSSHDMLNELFPLNDDGENPNHAYLSLFESAKKLNAEFLGTNAPRPWKRVIVRDGLSALPPQQVPANMRRGSDEYFERFFAAIGGHGDPIALEGYFMAQSYTDAFMAQSIVDETEAKLTFMTVGHFHSDYGHGLPSYVNDISNRQQVNFRLVDKSELDSDQLMQLKDDSLYGPVADYIVYF